MITTIAPVLQSVTVPLSQADAFELFTARFAQWWPATHSISPTGMETCVLEGREGGRWYERGADGQDRQWGSVLVWDPTARVVLSWGLQADYSFDADPERASEVEVTFTEVDGGTRLDLEHRHFAKHGDGGADVRGSVGGEGGWRGILALYAAAAGA